MKCAGERPVVLPSVKDLARLSTINECTTLDPPATPGKSQLFFLLHDPLSDTYFTTTGSLYGRFEINEGRVTSNGKPKYVQETPVATELTGKTVAEARSLM